MRYANKSLRSRQNARLTAVRRWTRDSIKSKNLD